MDFAALDVETANRAGEICSVGIALFESGAVAEEWHSLVDPKSDFDPFIVRIHGIDAHAVRGAPSFAEAMEEIRPLIDGRIVAAHNSRFDRGVMEREAERWRAPLPPCRWLDTLKVSRRAWPDMQSHRLSRVCRRIGHRFRHHDALEDAKAAGEVLLAAMREKGWMLEEVAAFAA